MKSKIVGTLIFCLIGAGSSISLRAVEPIGPAMPAETIYTLYAANPLAMKNYEKKRHQIHGIVRSAGRTSDGLPGLVLSGGEGALFSIHCVFPREAAALLSNILPTMHVIVEGELQGKSSNILFTGCKLLRTL